MLFCIELKKKFTLTTILNQHSIFKKFASHLRHLSPDFVCLQTVMYSFHFQSSHGADPHMVCYKPRGGNVKGPSLDMKTQKQVLICFCAFIVKQALWDVLLNDLLKEEGTII